MGGRPRGQGPVRAVPPRARAAGNMLQAVRVKCVRECARRPWAYAFPCVFIHIFDAVFLHILDAVFIHILDAVFMHILDAIFIYDIHIYI